MYLNSGMKRNGEVFIISNFQEVVDCACAVIATQECHKNCIDFLQDKVQYRSKVSYQSRRVSGATRIA